MYYAKKKYSQNFLIDQLIIDHLIRIINPKADQHLIEIGPGLGALTKKILPSLSNLDLIEIDRDFIPHLNVLIKSCPYARLYSNDALTFNFACLVKASEKLRIFGNLPYHISSPLIFHLLTFAPSIQDMHFMLQKEMAERLAAAPGTKSYGRLSVMAQYHYQIELLLPVPAEAFRPQPKVDSFFIKLIPYQQLPFVANHYDYFEKLVKQVFCHRRKTLQNTLKNLLTSSQIESSGISSQLRPEQLSVEQFVHLSNKVE